MQLIISAQVTLACKPPQIELSTPAMSREHLTNYVEVTTKLKSSEEIGGHESLPYTQGRITTVQVQFPELLYLTPVAIKAKLPR